MKICYLLATLSSLIVPLEVKGFVPTLKGSHKTAFVSRSPLVLSDAKSDAAAITLEPKHRHPPSDLLTTEESPIEVRTTNRGGGWLPKDARVAGQFIEEIRREAALLKQGLVEPVQTLKDMVQQDEVLNNLVENMFKEAVRLAPGPSVNSPSVESFDEFLVLLNHIVTKLAPKYTLCPSCESDESGALEPCGLVGFPINALLDWPMATKSGYVVFSNQLINQQFKKILDYWMVYLGSPASTNVLVEDRLDQHPPALAWLGTEARKELVEVANSAVGALVKPKEYENIFIAPKPGKGTWGYVSWDDFFTRSFVPSVRKVADPTDQNVIVSACESAPLCYETNVQLEDKFWLKGQPYSLQNMMNSHKFATEFAGGTVYQAFLSAMSYHRWHSPVSGKVVDAFVVDGTYYLENLYKGFSFDNPKPDPSAPNDSQPFLSAVATRAVIFIEADSKDIGLMCFIAIGMAEVSSCQITASIGQRLKKGDELGMFHFGGSTHCLCFNKDVKLDFIDYIKDSSGLDAGNIAVNSKIARASSRA